MRLKRCFATIAMVLVTVAPASAHHVIGGTAPASLFEGLLSGLAHPVIGMDHLAFVIALGLAAAFASDGLRLIALFIAGSLTGVIFQGLSTFVPHLELLVSLSIVGLGIGFVARRLSRSPAWWVFAVGAGLLHGLAYGESIAKSPWPAVVSYVVGLAVAQVMLALMAKTFVDLMRVDAATPLRGSRLVGGVLVAVGMAFATTSLLAI